MDFLQNRNVIINIKDNIINFMNTKIPMRRVSTVNNFQSQSIKLKLNKKVLIPPGISSVVYVDVPKLYDESFKISIDNSNKLEKKGIHFECDSISIDSVSKKAQITLSNKSKKPVMLNKHTIIGSVNNFEDLPEELPISAELPPPISEGDFKIKQLNSKIKEKLVKILLNHKDAFARSTIELSEAITEPHQIELQHNNPIRCPSYKIPFQLREEFRRQITELEKAGIISKSKSQYNAPALFVRQNNKYRLVLDFRKLNEITVPQEFTIPTLDEILFEISTSNNYMSTLDLKTAFNQIPIKESDRHKTAFSTPDGTKYEFNRLCFGLTNSPKAFQKIAQEALGDLLHKGALVYIDDIILYTKTIEEHFTLLNEVLDRFSKLRLRFNPDKCQFLTKSCKFLGFVLTPQGLSIDKDKTVKINEFQIPKDQTQVKSFLGLAGFYRRYIKNFSKRASPLTNLLRKDVPFNWNEETQNAFDDIKNAILNPPILALPDPNAELQITTDASALGIGAVLEQKYPNGEIKPLYFYSKKLNPSQAKYSATVLEFFAIYSALTFFRTFLIGRKFKVFTDHKPLEGFLSNKNPSSKILRWKLALEEFNYSIHYIKAKFNAVADHLSRCVNAVSIIFPNNSELVELQRQDTKLKTIIDKLESNDKSKYPNYYIDNNSRLIHLSKRNKKSPRQQPRKQICVPNCLKAKVLESVHSEIGGHLRFFKTYNRLADNFFWENMYKDAKNFVNSCIPCLARRSAFKVQTAPTQMVDQSTYPSERCHADIFGPLKETKSGNKYVLSMIDAFSKYIHLVALPNMQSETISKAFFNNYIVHRGCPKILVTDNAKYFSGNEFTEFCKVQGIEKIHISKYAAWVNGRVEKPNQSIANILATICNSNDEWDDLLPHTMLAINSAINESTHASPFFIEHLRDMRLPYTLGDNEQFQSHSEYTGKLIQSMEDIFSKVLENLKTQESKNISRSQVGKKAEKFNYPIGSLCFVKTPNLRKSNLSNKLQPKFDGPYRVIERFSEVNYKVRNVENNRKIFNCHVNRMIPYTNRFSYLHLTHKNIEDLRNNCKPFDEPSCKYNLRKRVNSN